MSVNSNNFASCLGRVRGKSPLVHCITNYVTVNDCANALLAIGASPVMADDIGEMEDIVSIADALVINIGTLNERTIRSMRVAMATAERKGVPILLDPVGAGASRLRTETARSFVADFPLTAIRGNASEIKVLALGTGSSRGVDAHGADGELDAVKECAEALAKTTGALVAVTGPTDVVTDGADTRFVQNGHPLLPRITGSGCMLSAIAGGFLGAFRNDGDANQLNALTAALCLSGFAGELAAGELAEGQHTARKLPAGTPDTTAVGGQNNDTAALGTGSFRTLLIDQFSLITETQFAEGIRCAGR